MAKEVVLTGLRTNGEYHLGNYIGALLPLVQLLQQSRSQYQINLFAPELHSFTTPIDFAQLYQQTLINLKLFVAAGLPLDDDNINLYRQSRIAAHSELTWILSNFASFGDLGRMVEFKQKAQQMKRAEQISAGLFIYPILMAADILLYDAKWVPVGDDQRQHLEFCRRLAKGMNQKFNQALFTIPATSEEQKTWLKRTEAPRIRSLRQPEQKMSKSIADPAGTIMLSDKPTQAIKKIMGATTDNYRTINYDWQQQPGVTNLLTILAQLTGQPIEQVIAQWQNSADYQSLKQAVADQVARTLEQIQTNLQAVSEATLEQHLLDREQKLTVVANQKLHQVHLALGLRRA